MTGRGQTLLRLLCGTLLAIACASWFVNPAITLVVLLAAGSAAGMVVMEWGYSAAAGTSRTLPPAVLLALSGGALVGAVACYFIYVRIEPASGLLGIAVYCFRTWALDRDRVAASAA